MVIVNTLYGSRDWEINNEALPIHLSDKRREIERSHNLDGVFKVVVNIKLDWEIP